MASTIEVTLSPETIAQVAREAARLVTPAQRDDQLRVYSMADFAERFCVCERTARYIRSAFPEYFLQIGKAWVITPNSLATFLEDFDAGRINLRGISLTAQSGTTR